MVLLYIIWPWISLIHTVIHIQFCLQVGWGFIRPLTLLPFSGYGAIDVFIYVYTDRCDGQLSNSIFYKEYTLKDLDSATVLQEVSNIVSTSTYFKQIGGCRNNQFMAKWAFEVTWIEVVDQYDACTSVSSIDENMVNNFLMKMALPLDITFLAAQHFPGSTHHRWGTDICCHELCTHWSADCL